MLRATMRSETACSVFTPSGVLVASVINEQPWALRMLGEAEWTRDMLDAALTLHGFIEAPDESESNWTPGQGMDPNRGLGHGHW